MLNTAPIFLNCFSRGGSNIFWNLFLSHPDVCSPIRETLELFRTGLRRPTLNGYRVALMSGQWRLFDQKYLEPRKPLSTRAQHFIDRVLYLNKLRTLADPEMRYKFEDEVYTLDEVQKARLTCKNNNGLTFLSDILLDMYPDATFFALVRHPLALYESYQRRRFITSVSEFVGFYRRIAERMVQDRQRYSNYHLIRFEDILAQPIDILRQVYSQANLPLDRIRKVRMKAKAHFNQDGQHTSQYTVGQHYWFTFDQVSTFLEPNINDYQIDRLGRAEREAILQGTAGIRQILGYAE